MVEFNLWGEALVFSLIYAVIIIIPCIIVAFIGRKMLYRLGQHPSQTPAIQMSIFFKLTFIEVVTFVFLIGFYNVFSG